MDQIIRGSYRHKDPGRIATIIIVNGETFKLDHFEPVRAIHTQRAPDLLYPAQGPIQIADRYYAIYKPIQKPVETNEEDDRRELTYA